MYRRNKNKFLVKSMGGWNLILSINPNLSLQSNVTTLWEKRIIIFPASKRPSEMRQRMRTLQPQELKNNKTILNFRFSFFFQAFSNENSYTNVNVKTFKFQYVSK